MAMAGMECFAMASATVSNTAKSITHADFGFTATQLAQADNAIICSRVAGIMYDWHPSISPTANLGVFLAANGSVSFPGTVSIGRLQFIREGAADATVTVKLERRVDAA